MAAYGGSVNGAEEKIEKNCGKNGKLKKVANNTEEGRKVNTTAWTWKLTATEKAGSSVKTPKLSILLLISNCCRNC